MHFKKVDLGFSLTVDETLFGAEGPLFLNLAVLINYVYISEI